MKMKADAGFCRVTLRGRDNWAGNVSVMNKEKNVRKHSGEGT